MDTIISSEGKTINCPPDIPGNTPSEKWENLKRYIVQQSNKINRETPALGTEPDWWTEMMEVQRIVLSKSIKTQQK